MFDDDTLATTESTQADPVTANVPVDALSVQSMEPVPTTAERVREQLHRIAGEVEATPVVGDAYDWLRAIALGVRDTARDMLDEGRKGAKAAETDAWRRFDDKTKYRRNRQGRR